MHVASPIVITQPKDASVLIKPALEGTINICKACTKAKVKRLVITSSSAAIKDQLDANISILTEENWSVVDKNPNITSYGKSKTLAERAAWDFQAKLPEKERFELVTLCPSFVSGPSMCHAGYTTSEGIRYLLYNQFPVISLY